MECQRTSLHLLVAAAAGEAASLAPDEEVAVLDEAGERHPELDVGDDLLALVMPVELVEGHTTDEVQDQQARQTAWALPVSTPHQHENAN